MQPEPNSLSSLVDRLSQANWNSQEAYAYAAQHTRNRGLKLVLKSYAQERALFQEQLRSLPAAQAGGSPAAASGASAAAVGRGWTSIRAWFTIRRQSRQRLLLQKARQRDQDAIALYEDVIRKQAPAAADELVHTQLAALRRAQKRLVALQDRGQGSALLVRLYEEPQMVAPVMAALEDAGVAGDDVYIADVAQIQLTADDAPARERARWETMAAAAVVGALIGAIIVLPFAFAQRIYLPQVNGIFTDSPSGVLLEYLVGGALVGAIFGLYFSIFIGQDIVEDDAYFYEQSLEKGKVLLAVPATSANRNAVEKALGLQDQVEIKPQPV